MPEPLKNFKISQIGRPEGEHWTEVLFVALLEGEPIGYCSVRIDKRKQGHTDLYVHHDYRRRGVGHVLKDAAIEYAFRNGAKQMVTYTYWKNTASVQNCIKAGYDIWKWSKDKKWVWLKLTPENWRRIAG